jgi:hypothetical protein
LGRKALAEVAQMFRPETILGWHRRLVARSSMAPKSDLPLGVRPRSKPWKN